ncbi:MAG: hypothetical protein KGI67_09285 [Pseudomonadota bacterium]|nr:hypothetical protein [Pseudomonadota bacterium]
MLPAADAADVLSTGGSRSARDPSPSEGTRTMTTDKAANGKSPRPPQSTLDFREHVEALRLYLGIAYSGAADQDFASLLAVQRHALVALANIELAHGTDPELRAAAQRIVDAAPADDAALKRWQDRHAG